MFDSVSRSSAYTNLKYTINLLIIQPKQEKCPIYDLNMKMIRILHGKTEQYNVKFFARL